MNSGESYTAITEYGRYPSILIDRIAAILRCIGYAECTPYEPVITPLL